MRLPYKESSKTAKKKPCIKHEIFSKATDLRHPDVYMQLLELTDTGAFARR